MLAPKENIYHLSLIGKGQKRDITQSIMYEIYSGLIHLGHKLCAKYHDPSSSDCPYILFTMSLMAEMPKSEQWDYSVKYSLKFTKS